MNKVDRLYKWNSVPNSPIQDAFARQEEYVRKEFDDRFNQASCCFQPAKLFAAVACPPMSLRWLAGVGPASDCAPEAGGYGLRPPCGGSPMLRLPC